MLNEKPKPVKWRTGSKVLPIIVLELEPVRKKVKHPKTSHPKGRKGKGTGH